MSRVRTTPVDSDRLVNRLKNTNLDKFHTLCKMHLSFLLHLPGSSLEEILGGSSALPATPGTFSAEKPKSHFRHFGKKRCQKENKILSPSAIDQGTLDQAMPLVEYLGFEQNLKQEGLFRKSGHIGRQKILREKLYNREDVHLELEQGVYSAHDCANVLKSCLSDLPEPLLTDKLYLAHCQVSEMDQQSKQLQTLQLLIQLLPNENLFLLRCLLKLLNKTAEESSNKMTSETLGTLFAPHLFVPRKTSGTELHAVAGDLTKTAAFMIDNATNLFKIPELLLADIATYWSQMEEETMEAASALLPPTTPDTPRIRYRKPVDPTDAPINTTVTFTDRQASLQAAKKTDTQMALAQLYAHVASLPESAKKRKFMHKFHKSNCASPTQTNNRHKRTRSFGDSLKKLVHRNHRRRDSGDMLQFHLDDSHCSFKDTDVTMETPSKVPSRSNRIVKLFSSELEDSMISENHPVHIVDMKENADPRMMTQSRKRKSAFTESTVPAAPLCSAVFLSPIGTLSFAEDSIVERSPFPVNSKKRTLTENASRLTI